jgi:cyclase
MPVAVGGGVRNGEQASLLFKNGADKIVLNSSFFSQPEFITELVNGYGAQSIVASIDYKRTDDGATRVFVECGRKDAGGHLGTAVAKVVELGAGEIYLTSIDRDGTGMGYDLTAIEQVYRSCDLPLIVAGGADTYDQLAEGIMSGFASAVSTSHLFNFMGDGLKDAREGLENLGINLSRWNFEELK